MEKRKTILTLFMVAIFIVTGFCPQEVTHASAKKDIAKVSIVSDGSGAKYGTHAFIYVKNESKKDINVLSIKVSPKSGITIGTFGNRADGLC